MGKSDRGGNFRRQRESGSMYEEQVEWQPREREPRPPLEWREVTTLSAGSTQAVISEAIGQRGDKLYSFVLGRVAREKTSKFFQPRDTADLAQLITEVQSWLEAQAGAQS